MNEWIGRVDEVEAELDMATKKEASQQAELKKILDALQKYESTVEKERTSLFKRIGDLEEKAKTLKERNDKAEAARAEAEAAYNAAMSRYDELREEVAAVKQEEEALANRPDLALTLQQETNAWAEHERTLREQTAELEQQVREQRRVARGAITALEEQLGAQEEALQREREQRRAEGCTDNAIENQGKGIEVPEGILVGPKSRKRDILGDYTNTFN